MFSTKLIALTYVINNDEIHPADVFAAQEKTHSVSMTNVYELKCS